MLLVSNWRASNSSLSIPSDVETEKIKLLVSSYFKRYGTVITAFPWSNRFGLNLSNAYLLVVIWGSSSPSRSSVDGTKTIKSSVSSTWLFDLITEIFVSFVLFLWQFNLIENHIMRLLVNWASSNSRRSVSSVVGTVDKSTSRHRLTPYFDIHPFFCFLISAIVGIAAIILYYFETDFETFKIVL